MIPNKLRSLLKNSFLRVKNDISILNSRYEILKARQKEVYLAIQEIENLKEQLKSQESAIEELKEEIQKLNKFKGYSSPFEAQS